MNDSSQNVIFLNRLSLSVKTLNLKQRTITIHRDVILLNLWRVGYFTIESRVYCLRIISKKGLVCVNVVVNVNSVKRQNKY